MAVLSLVVRFFLFVIAFCRSKRVVWLAAAWAAAAAELRPRVRGLAFTSWLIGMAKGVVEIDMVLAEVEEGLEVRSRFLCNSMLHQWWKHGERKKTRQMI